MKENIKYWVSRKTFQKVPLSTYEAVLTSLPTHFGQSQKKIPNVKFWQKNCKNNIFQIVFVPECLAWKHFCGHVECSFDNHTWKTAQSLEIFSLKVETNL